MSDLFDSMGLPGEADGAAVPEKKAKFEPSSYQLAIFRNVAEGRGHSVVIARAGSGKTSTIVEAFAHIPRGCTALMCAFNKDIAVELKSRAPKSIEVSTLHSYGLRQVTSAYGRVAIADGKRVPAKTDQIVRGLIGSQNNFDERRAICKIVSLAKSMLCSTREQLDGLIDTFQVEGWGESVKEREAVINNALAALELSKPRKTENGKTVLESIDFDDMVWLPVVMNLRCWQFDRVFIDETQDLSPAQIELALKAVKPGGRILAVGDDRQAIYGFRGADSRSIPNLIERLRAHVMPLSVTYRCARAIVAEAKAIVPDIEPAAHAVEGQVLSGNEDMMKNLAAPGDFILSRTNAPLVPLCLGFLREGRKASVKGRDIGASLAALVRKSETTKIEDLANWVEAWKNREVARLLAKEQDTQAVEDRAETIEAISDGAQSVAEVLSRIEALFSDMSDEERIVLSTTHKCVAPETWVETSDGMKMIREIASEGVIGTAEGAASYRSKVEFQNRKMLRLRTKSGYEVSVTADHGMMVWSPEKGVYARKEAWEIGKGDFLRLRLGATIDVADAVLPLASAKLDVRSEVYRVPARVTPEAAEFFGLMVADGTLYKNGFRLKKRHQDVAQRFASLIVSLFGKMTAVTTGKNTFDVEVNSAMIAAWLRDVSGMGPNEKAVPTSILRSSLSSQAAFLRGLFEDGTVNVADGRLDHASLTTVYPEIAKTVQLMLLRQGIISSRTLVCFEGKTSWRVSIYGCNAHKFRDAIGFVSGYKNGLLQVPTGNEEGYVIPVDVSRLPRLRDLQQGTPAYSARNNARSRGYVSRHGAKALGGLGPDIAFHHDRVVSVEEYEGPAMCVEVPSVGRFLQNGFDGFNCKGLERKRVFMLIDTYAKGRATVEAENLRYVAVTRAKETLWYIRTESKVPKAVIVPAPAPKGSDLPDWADPAVVPVDPFALKSGRVGS